MLLIQLITGNVAREVGELGLLGAAHVLADGNELHLWGDDSLPGVPELSDRMPCGSAEWLTLATGEAWELDQAVSLGGAGILGVLA